MTARGRVEDLAQAGEAVRVVSARLVVGGATGLGALGVALKDGALHLGPHRDQAVAQLTALRIEPAAGLECRELVLEGHAAPSGDDRDVGRLADVGAPVVGDGSEFGHELGLAVVGVLRPRVDESVGRFLVEAIEGREGAYEQLVHDRLEILPDQGRSTRRVEQLAELRIAADGLVDRLPACAHPQVDRHAHVLLRGLLVEGRMELTLIELAELSHQGDRVILRDEAAADVGGIGLIARSLRLLEIRRVGCRVQCFEPSLESVHELDGLGDLLLCG